ncbi:MAG TPA: PilN domain-containing protein [Clostridiaceae bacterium]|jgi:Tfp pilus assembly protein PilN|nr:PilN domain-containing protein [Clostridiaceae bacterium]
MKDINLLPKYYLQERQNKAKRYKITLIAVIGLTLLFASIAYPLLVKYSLALRSETILTQIKASSNYIEVQNQFNLIKELYQQRMETGNKLRKNGIEFLLVMDKLEKAMPENMTIVSMSSTQGENSSIRISLNGIASSQESVATFIRNLRTDGYFDDVVLHSLLKSGEEIIGSQTGSPSDVKYGFNMSILIEGGE